MFKRTQVHNDLLRVIFWIRAVDSAVEIYTLPYCPLNSAGIFLFQYMSMCDLATRGIHLSNDNEKLEAYYYSRCGIVH